MTGSIPRSYAQWRHCIEVDCGIPLSPDYVDARLRALADPGDFHTQQFLRRWGSEHHGQVMAWFRQARAAMAADPSSA